MIKQAAILTIDSQKVKISDVIKSDPNQVKSDGQNHMIISQEIISYLLRLLKNRAI